MEYSVIIPVYNESKSLAELTDRIYSAFKGMGREKNFEVLFIDDGSTDSSRNILRKLCADRPYVKSIFLRRNNGKSFALMAGFLHSDSDFVITMDGDLQDNPEEIRRFIKKINEGYDLVSGWKQKRQDRWIRKIGSKLFNRVVSLLGGIRLHDFNCGFKIYRSQVIKSLSIYGQYHRFLPLLAKYLGFKVAELPISHTKRKYGFSKYANVRYQGFFDLLSILFIYRYRFSPFYFFGSIGLILIIPSLVTLAILIGKHILYLLGFGGQYVLLNRPLFALSSTLCILGLNICLTGFVCDFILHHIGKSRMAELVKVSVEEVHE